MNNVVARLAFVGPGKTVPAASFGLGRRREMLTRFQAFLSIIEASDVDSF